MGELRVYYVYSGTKGTLATYVCHLWVNYGVYYIYSGTKGTVAREVGVPSMGELRVCYLYSSSIGTYSH